MHALLFRSSFFRGSHDRELSVLIEMEGKREVEKENNMRMSRFLPFSSSAAAQQQRNSITVECFAHPTFDLNVSMLRSLHNIRKMFDTVCLCPLLKHSVEFASSVNIISCDISRDIYFLYFSPSSASSSWSCKHRKRNREKEEKSEPSTAE